MKVLFLDIDGVLNSSDNLIALSLLRRDLNTPDSDIHGHLFDERCVRYLTWIVNKTDCKIVISSSWRVAGYGRMVELWKDRNLPGEVIDITRRNSKVFDEVRQIYRTFDCRGEEILDWLTHSAIPIESYCIVDDDSDMLESQKSNFVKVKAKFGLTKELSDEIIEILNRSDK